MTTTDKIQPRVVPGGKRMTLIEHCEELERAIKLVNHSMYFEDSDPPTINSNMAKALTLSMMLVDRVKCMQHKDPLE